MKIGILGDTHIPAMHHEYLDFCWEVCEQWDVPLKNVYHIGDVYDFHSMSRWDSELGLENPLAELDLAREQAADLYHYFPNLNIMTGNHDAVPVRAARSAGIPPEIVKDLNSIFDTPRWTWQPRFAKLQINDFQLMHGDQGRTSKTPALTQAEAGWMSTAAGHHHTRAGVWWGANSGSRFWGMNVGTGIDHNSPVFNYSRQCANKPILGMGVVIDGTPYFEPMPLVNKFGRKIK